MEAQYETEWVGFTGRIKIEVNTLKIKLELHSYSKMQGLISHKPNDVVNKQHLVRAKKEKNGNWTLNTHLLSKIRNMISLAKRPLSDQTTNF